MKPAYYNEIDKFAAQWLRNLIAAGHIAPGDVDERSIEDVRPSDLHGYAQCHFFAGVGVWSYALRRAGWPDDRSVWTGSCPCQPFSAAGEGAGFDDERHLWPDFHHLIRECRPAAVFGEQVASKDANPWIDLVCADMEAMDYRFGAVPFPSAGVGAPHIRDRLYWAARAGNKRRVGAAGVLKGMADTGSTRLPNCKFEDISRTGRRQKGGAAEQRSSTPTLGMDYAERFRFDKERNGHYTQHDGQFSRSAVQRSTRPGPTNSMWTAADWLQCRDGKWRPVESGSFPLAHGATARVGRLRAYGNAINAEAARVFIETVMECAP